MKKTLALFVLFFSLFLTTTSHAFAIEDPLSHPNNKIGIHILFPSELNNAAKLINSNGGQWGYVLIPIQSGDKDLKKWQAFLDQCKELHLIPIIRLATEGDYFNTTAWRKPDFNDIVDFANFLDSLNWPTKNRYIVVYNEVNRGDEWGGTPNPSEYAQLLSYAVTAFKERSEDFFIISAGMDNAAPTSSIYMNEYTYLSQMNQAVPGIFNQIDGIASHSYPNPAFSQPPTVNTRMSIDSFFYEKSLVDSLSNKSHPVFITETGWSQDAVGKQTAATYFLQALNSPWNDASIVAITPFLLQAGNPPFATFSFLDGNGNPSPLYTAIQNIPKTKGEPTLNESVLSAQVVEGDFQMKKFVPSQPDKKTLQLALDFKEVFKWLLRMP